MTGREPVRLAALLALALPVALPAQRAISISDAERILAPLVESYGVSRAEGPVRERVRKLLPDWARSETDTAGNLWVRVGRGAPLVVFVAHLDELGFRVTGIRDDGQLLLSAEGGFFTSLYEAEPALVHTGRGIVPGVFPPRDSIPTRRSPGDLRVDVGTTTRAATEALGIDLSRPERGTDEEDAARARETARY